MENSMPPKKSGAKSASKKTSGTNGHKRATTPLAQYKAIKEIPTKELHFDIKNPRLPNTINKSDDQAVIKWMLRDASVIELMIAIGEKGYFPGEPLLVTPTLGKKNSYVVVEGNRRLCAVKLLNSPEIAPVRQQSIQIASEEAKFRPQKLPAIVYDKREDILDYLGYRHITGIKEWDPLAKAKYLKDLRETVKALKPEEQFKALARAIGSRSNYVRLLLTSLSIYETIERNKFFGFDLDEEKINFSVLTTALGYPNLVEFIGLDDGDDPDFVNINVDNLEALTSWMFVRQDDNKTRLGESRNLGDLSAVVASPKALEAFTVRGFSLKEAVRLTGAPLSVFRESIGNAKKNLQVANDTIYTVDGIADADSTSILEVIKIARQVKTLVDQKIMGDEDI
jgi:hypothetical protein